MLVDGICGNRIRPMTLVNPSLTELRERFHNLRGQAYDLRNPLRSTGPSRYEAEETAAQMDREADEVSEELYWASYAAISAATTR